MAQMNVGRSSPSSSVFWSGNVIFARRLFRKSGRSGGISTGYGGLTPPLRQWLARGALLLALRVLDAVRRLGHELQARRRYFSSTDDASPIFTAVQAAKGLIDEAKASLEHRLSREVELPRLRLTGDVGGVLVGEGDVPAALTLRDREALLDAFDRRREVSALA